MTEAPKRIDLTWNPAGGDVRKAYDDSDPKVAYVRADIADEHKRQRDRLMEAAKAICRLRAGQSLILRLRM